VSPCLSSPGDAASVLIELLQDEPAEVFAILCVTTKHLKRFSLIQAEDSPPLDQRPAYRAFRFLTAFSPCAKVYSLEAQH
jgi:hypothetical protein